MDYLSAAKTKTQAGDWGSGRPLHKTTTTSRLKQDNSPIKFMIAGHLRTQ